MAIRDSGADTIPSEAALETPLTVEEAAEILSRLVDRGHPVVESRDGALFTLLGQALGPGTGLITVPASPRPRGG